MWCKHCNIETINEVCEKCGAVTEEDLPYELMWCENCKTPIIKVINDIGKYECPLCGSATRYMASDARPVFPEERLLLEILTNKEPLTNIEDSIWADNNRYFINGKALVLTNDVFQNADTGFIREQLEKYKSKNRYDFFNEYIKMFIKANKERLNLITYEALKFVNEEASNYSEEHIIISFSGGKDSTVAQDLTVRALSNPNLYHIFGDTTLEFPLTLEYVNRFIEKGYAVRIAKNKEQDFYDICEDIGPPARMMRWCCSMFKTGPISRIIKNRYEDADVLTFYGIRKCESVSRSKYNRIEKDSESVKIQRQTVASPIFFWKDIDIWLYILGNEIDFNDAYRLGYDRVGCWCCPNNNIRAQFLSKIYMPEQFEKWREFLIDFAKRIGKTDPEVYVDEGKWKARQGGNGVKAAEDVKVKSSNCTTEDHAQIYKLNKPVTDELINLFIPFGIVSKEMGRKLVNEVIILDSKKNIPILSIQPFDKDGYEYSVKIKTMNVKKHEDLQRMASYQIKKYNACRMCLKCESLCRFGAISITAGEYAIDEQRCKRCKMCVSAKFLDGGCTMDKYLRTK